MQASTGKSSYSISAYSSAGLGGGKGGLNDFSKHKQPGAAEKNIDAA
jgi:hypothetical protein